MLARILEFVAVVTLATPIAIFGHVFYDEHLPAFKVLQAKVFFQECVAECEAVCYRTCELNGWPEDACKCDCSHCHKFIHDGEHD